MLHMADIHVAVVYREGCEAALHSFLDVVVEIHNGSEAGISAGYQSDNHLCLDHNLEGKARVDKGPVKRGKMSGDVQHV